MSLILVTPTNPGVASWTDASLVPTPPSGPAGGDLDGTYPDPSVVGFNGIPIDTGAPANGDVLTYNNLTNTWEHSPIVGGGGPPTGPAGGDLGGIYPNPGVVGLQGQALSGINVANGFLKRNAANGAWEEVTYGTTANSVCQGNDARLSDPRTPTGAAGGDLAGTYPNPTVDGLQTRPVASTAPAINDALCWNGSAWSPQAVGAGAITAVYGSFYSLADQPVPQAPAQPLVIACPVVGGGNGVSVVGNTQITVAQSGVYEFTISLQLLHTGGTADIILFWLRKNGLDVPDSASSLEMGNNNNRTLPFVPITLNMNAGEYIEWVITATNTANTSVEAFPAVLSPPAAFGIPAIPSVIISAKRLGA